MKVLEVCVYTVLCVIVHMGVCTRMRRPGRPIGGHCILGKLFPEYIYCSLCIRTTQPHRIARQYFRCLEFVDNINHIRRIQIEFQTKFLTTLWAFEILKKYFADSLPSLSKIKHCRPVLNFWERIHNT